MCTIIEQLETEIPKGYWCDNGGKKCPYLIIEKPHLAKNGTIQSHFCDLLEEYVYRKECGVNEDL